MLSPGARSSPGDINPGLLAGAVAALLAVAGVASQGGKAKGAAKGAARDLKLRQPGKVAARVQVGTYQCASPTSQCRRTTKQWPTSPWRTLTRFSVMLPEWVSRRCATQCTLSLGESGLQRHQVSWPRPCSLQDLSMCLRSAA